MRSLVQKIKDFALKRPYTAMFLGVFSLFSIMAFQGLAYTFTCDYFVYVSVSQNLHHWGTLYKDAIDTKNTSFLFTFFAFIYYPYARLFATTEFLHIANAIVITLWYTGLSYLIYLILEPFYGKKPALFSVLAFLLFLAGNRHSLFFNQPQVALMAVLLLILVMTRTYEKQGFSHYFIYGIFLGISFLYASPYALLIFVIPVLAWHRMKLDAVHKKRRFVLRGLVSALGFLMAVYPYAMYFLSRNALGEWWYWNVTHTNSYYAHAEFYVMSGLQVLPALLFAPWFFKNQKKVFGFSLLAYALCFIIFFSSAGLAISTGNRDLFNGAWELDFLQRLQTSDNLFLRLCTVMYDIPWKNAISRLIISAVTFFTGNSILIVHTPQIIYHYFLLNSIMIGSIIAMLRFKKSPPLPIFVIGILSLAGRLNLSRGAGSDSYNLYLVPLVVLWIPFVMEQFEHTVFPKIQKSMAAIALFVALALVPVWGFLTTERLTDYSAQVKEIVRLNPDKTPTLITYPWAFSYSTRWVHKYYNMYPDIRSSYADRMREENPEVVLFWDPKLWREFKPEMLDGLTNYTQVSDDFHWLFIRNDKLPEWKLPAE